MRLLTGVTAVLLLTGATHLGRPSAQTRPEPPPYRILVTNDDGVRAPGIAAVAQVLQAIGTVIIVAPAEQQSGSGHGLTTRDPVFRQDLSCLERHMNHGSIGDDGNVAASPLYISLADRHDPVTLRQRCLDSSIEKFVFEV